MLSIKPKFEPTMILLQSLIVGLVAVFLLGPIMIPFYFPKRPQDAPLLVDIVPWMEITLILLTVGSMLLYYVFKKYTYQKTNYVFSDGKVAFEEGFLNINKKEIEYSRILEIHLSRNVLQRMFNLGTVILMTAASPMGASAIGTGGIKIRDIEQSEEYYQKIRAMIKG